MTHAPARPWTIAEIEHDTGLGKDTLRAWERRYGFPQPQRDAQGNRLYDEQQVERLRLVRRLLLAGHRPGQLLRLPEAELLALGAALQQPAAAPGHSADSPRLSDAALHCLHTHDSTGLQQLLAQALGRLGLTDWVMHLLAPLIERVGSAWVQGHLAVHQEHLFSAVVQQLMQQALAALPLPPRPARPRVLLSTLPDEQHGLGLLMARCLLTQAGCDCIDLGTSTPVDDIAAAAQAHHADIVALSATSCQPPRRLREQLEELRQRLPARITVWVGGAGAGTLQIPGCICHTGLEAIAPAVAAWRMQAAAHSLQLEHPDRTKV